MSLCGTDQDKQRLVKRLNRIEGQVRGLRGMIESDQDCIDVLRQVASVSGPCAGCGCRSSATTCAAASSTPCWITPTAIRSSMN